MEPEEIAEDIVIVGAGLSGLATALGLHRKGVRSLVLESSPELRASGFAFTAWKNAFRALDALGAGDRIRKQHLQAQALRIMSSATGGIPQEVDLTMQGKGEPNEISCVRRDLLLQALEEELPRGTVRYSSKIVSIEEDGELKILQLADGSVPRAKVLIGCDGINSLVARWLGLAKPSYSGRMAMRGLAHFPDGHGFEPKFLQFIGHGFRSAAPACDPATRLTSTGSSRGLLPKTVCHRCPRPNVQVVYTLYGKLYATRKFYLKFRITEQCRTKSPDYELCPDTTRFSCVLADKGVPDRAAKMKHFVLANLRSLKVPAEALSVIERSEMNDVLAVPLRLRSPLSLITASICKGNVCVAGDALHPITPDLSQGGCSALEDAVVLARCLGKAILEESRRGDADNKRIEAGLNEYAKFRRWRSIQLITTAYAVGFIQQSNNVIISFLREKFLSGFLARRLLKMAEYNCGTL